MLHRINQYFIPKRKLTLTIMWILFGIDFSLALFLAIVYPNMAFTRFFGIIIVPAIPMVYFRVLYGMCRDYAKQQEEENGVQHLPAAKKKKRKKR